MCKHIITFRLSICGGETASSEIFEGLISSTSVLQPLLRCARVRREIGGPTFRVSSSVSSRNKRRTGVWLAPSMRFIPSISHPPTNDNIDSNTIRPHCNTSVRERLAAGQRPIFHIAQTAVLLQHMNGESLHLGRRKGARAAGCDHGHALHRI